MIKRIQKRLENREEGFTLIELMVVVLIIAILIAIAIPTFLGARTRAQDRAAQSSLRNTVTSAKAIFTDREDYADATAAALASSEPALTFKADAVDSTGQNDVSVDQPASPATSFHAAVLSKSGTCWFVRDAVDPAGNPGTGWAKDTASNPVCDGDRAAGITSTSYQKEPANATEV